MKILKNYIKENIGILFLGVIFLTINTFATLAIPFQISNIINLGIMKKDIDMVYSTSIKMIVILILGTVTGIIANHFIALFATNFSKQNRKQLIRNIESLTVDQVSDFGVASLVTRMSNDNNNAQRLIVAFFQMISPSPIMAIISIFMTVKLSPTLALIPLFTILLFAFTIVLTLFKSLPYILKVQKKLDRMTLVLRERFIGAKIIRAFDNSKKERDKFNDIAQDYTDNYIIINKKFALLSPMAFSLMSVVITLIIFFGAMKVLNNNMAGERFAIVGATGSGKSTIAKVLLRLNDIEDGEILVNNVNSSDLPLTCLRNQISYIPQKAYIFSGNIKDNFRFVNKNMTDEEMIKIAKVAQSYDFIDSLPDKFDSFVAQGGTNFSGGQKQRLSITRAF